MRYHQMPPDLIAAMAAGGGGPRAAAVLTAAQHSKHLLLLHGVVSTAASARHPQAEAAREGYRLLARVQQQDPGAVAAVVHHPSVGAWAYRTVTALRGGPDRPGAVPAGMGAIAAAAAIRAGVRADIEIPVTGGIAMLPSAGAAGPFDGPVATVRGQDISCAGRSVRIPADVREPAPGWRPLAPLLPGLVVDDVDPFRMPAAPHTARDVDVTAWTPAFTAAQALLNRWHPDVAAEVAAMITVVVPLARPAEGQVSSSSPETFGAIAMSDPADPVSLAVTLTHEVQHVKLSALLDLVQLTSPDSHVRLYAPWRDDPRPASGLLQGTYAYLGVTGFWRRQRAAGQASGLPDADVEFARWRQAAADGAATLLSSGQLTAAGTDFVGGIAGTLAAWHDDPVPLPAREQAAAANARHLARWQAAHG
jgi:HEXXH motif-containing protein